MLSSWEKYHLTEIMRMCVVYLSALQTWMVRSQNEDEDLEIWHDTPKESRGSELIFVAVAVADGGGSILTGFLISNMQY